MKRIPFFLLAISALADTPPADILDRIGAAYKRLNAIKVVATRHDQVVTFGQGSAGGTEYFFAEKAGNKYRVQIKSDGAAALVVSDGAATWKALPGAKQWTRVLAATSQTIDDGEKDLRSEAKVSLLARFIAMAASATEVSFVKEETHKLEGGKVPCYVIRVKTPQVMNELWVDKERFFVLQHHEFARIKTSNGAAVDVKVSLKVKEFATDSDVPESLFTFEPQKNWAEVEMLVLPGEDRVILVGQRAANFTLKTLDGEPVTLDSHRGKTVVVDFWATWCGPCRTEMPHLEKLRQEFAGKVEFLGVNDEQAGTVRDFIKQHQYTMPVLMDGNRQVHKRYGVRAIPTLLIVDKEGFIREHFIGSRSEETLRAAINRVVGGN
jgi:thiol-disulfide isomerase/thioredoxin/outer membrane lipoprotein-sorting protein